MVHLLESARVMNKYYSCLERPHSQQLIGRKVINVDKQKFGAREVEGKEKQLKKNKRKEKQLC